MSTMLNIINRQHRTTINMTKVVSSFQLRRLDNYWPT